MTYPTIVGLLIIAIAGTVFACGLYSTNGILKDNMNKLLIIICGALLVWATGFAIIAVADNTTISLFGQTVAPVGWGLMPAALLHFTLLLIEKEELLKKWWIYPVLYLPSALIIYGYTILPIMGKVYFDFKETAYGWVLISKNDIWSKFFYLYYCSFTFVNLLILILTRIKSKDKIKRHQVGLLIISYMLVNPIIVFSDFAAIHLNIIPQISPIFSLIPIVAMAHSVNQYGKLSDNKFRKSEVAITYDVHSNVYKILGISLVAGSIINIISQNLIYKESAIPQIKEFSLFLILVAVSIIIINKSKINGKTKEMIISIAFSFVIPYITLRYVKYGSVSIWAFIFLLIIICMLYNRKILLITITISSTMSQLLVWAISPTVLIEIDAADYIVRLSLICISSILSIYVNNVYVAKLKENKLHVEKQAILSKITREFISAKEWNTDDIIYNILKKCGQFIGCERAFIALFEEDPINLKIRYSCEWYAGGVKSHMNNFEELSSDTLKILLKKFETEKIVKLDDTRYMTNAASKFQKLLIKQNIRSLISLPIKEKGKIIGFMGFNSSTPLKRWGIDSIEFIEISSNIVSDILAKIETKKKIEFLAYHDQLTQLPNRIHFKRHLEQTLSEAGTTNKMIGVVFIDIDSFKTVNDTMGHETGDKLLLGFSQLLSKSISGNSNIISRFGGDEFAIMLNEVSSKQDVIEIMEKLMSVIRKPVKLQEQEFFITVSAGISLYPEDGMDFDTLIKNADIAMYNAKGLGKNRYLICSKDMKDKTLEKTIITNYLYRALERDQFKLYYQPQVNIETNTIVGFEALIRWYVPEKGMISPNVFIPLAEQAGLINSIGEWVLRTACRQNKLWQQSGISGLRMAVNVSVMQLNSPGFVQQVDKILKETGISPRDLELEVTESVVSNNVESLIDVLSKLKELGVTISIDDFGTEYSSLSRLQLLPIDRIKMDMQFIRDIEVSERDQAITKAIIKLAKTMDLKVIAEGVETEFQLKFLSSRLCDEVQGYYFYKPMPADEIEKILMQDN